MPVDFLANDFEAIARAMRRQAPPQAVLLRFWNMFALAVSEHESVEAAVEEAYALAMSETGIPEQITTPDGTVLLDTEALAEAMMRFGEGMPD